MALNLIIKVIYNLVLAIILSFFVTFGVSLFYVSPSAPQTTPCAPTPVSGGTTTCNQAYEAALQAKYNADIKAYSQNVSFIILFFSICFVALGIWVYFKFPTFSGGVLLAALFTFFFSLTNVANTSNQGLRFGILCVGFILLLVVGYVLFIRKNIEKTSK